MILTSVVVAGGALATSVKVYRDKKREKEFPWTVAAERMAKNKLVLSPKKNSLLVGQKRSFAKIEQAKDFFQKIKEKQITPFFSDSRGVVAQPENEISAEEREVNHYLTYSCVSLALATAGMWYPVFNVLYVPCFLYILQPSAAKAYEAVVKEKKVGVAITELLGCAGPFLVGHFFIASFAICLINFSNKLILKTEDHSRGSLINIFGEQPRSIWIEKAGVEVEIPFESLSIGDIVVVHAGQMIVVDGIITKGEASIDERALTGEFQPVEKSVGEQVFASTILLAGRIGIQVQKAGRDTVAAQIGNILNSTADFKSSVVSRGKRIIDLGAPPTVAFSLLAWPLLGLESALALLYAGFGYHMKYAAPVSVLNFLRITSENGILIKDGRSLELLSEIDTVVFDKTGTLTEEVPSVGTIYTVDGISEEELLTYAAAAEYKQTHPIALAITKEAHIRELTLPQIDDAKYEVGYGLKVKVSQKVVFIGSRRFMEMEGVAISPDYKKIEEASHFEGHSLVYVAIDNHHAGAIELVPTIRPEVQLMTSELRKRRIGMVIISGDHEAPTQALAQSLGIDHYFAEVLPQDKACLIEKMQNEGKSVCFIGDGINDSIALKKANVGISMRGASTIATDTAGIILMDGTLNQFIPLLDIASELDANLTRSTIMTIVPGAICVVGVFFFHLGMVGSLMLYNLGLTTSISNALLPLVKHEINKRQSQRAVSELVPSQEMAGELVE